MKNLSIPIFITLLYCGCKETANKNFNYPKNETISNVQGVPNDSLTYYFPDSITFDSQVFQTNLEVFKLNWYSSALFSAEEPILFNYYLGHDIYRFLWLRSFHKPMVFSLHKDGNKVWLSTKQLNKQPQFIDITWSKFVEPFMTADGEIDTANLDEKYHNRVDSVIKADRKANIILNQTKQLSNEEWAEFESLLNASSFWTSNPLETSFGLDGSEWIIEAHLKEKYWFVSRWSPKVGIRNAGAYLIEKSGVDEEIY